MGWFSIKPKIVPLFFQTKYIRESVLPLVLTTVSGPWDSPSCKQHIVSVVLWVQWPYFTSWISLSFTLFKHELTWTCMHFCCWLFYSENYVCNFLAAYTCCYIVIIIYYRNNCCHLYTERMRIFNMIKLLPLPCESASDLLCLSWCKKIP